MLRRILLVLVVAVATTGLQAQTDRQYVRNGNKYFLRGDFKRADLEYRKALSLNENNTQALYNRGCAIMQESPDSALACFGQAGKLETNKIRKAMAYHNIGWIYHSNQQYDLAIEAYKEALRNNPDDNETRYNLQLAKLQKKQNQDQNQDQNKNQQDQNKDQQDQNKNQQDQNKDQQDQNKDQNKDSNQDQQDSKEQQAQPQQISDDNAERLLDAAMQEEKRTQDRLNKAMQQPRRKVLQKNW